MEDRSDVREVDPCDPDGAWLAVDLAEVARKVWRRSLLAEADVARAPLALAASCGRCPGEGVPLGREPSVSRPPVPSSRESSSTLRRFLDGEWPRASPEVPAWGGSPVLPGPAGWETVVTGGRLGGEEACPPVGKPRVVL